jgi:hypothetical protein
MEADLEQQLYRSQQQQLEGSMPPPLGRPAIQRKMSQAAMGGGSGSNGSTPQGDYGSPALQPPTPQTMGGISPAAGGTVVGKRKRETDSREAKRVRPSILTFSLLAVD